MYASHLHSVRVQQLTNKDSSALVLQKVLHLASLSKLTVTQRYPFLELLTVSVDCRARALADFVACSVTGIV